MAGKEGVRISADGTVTARIGFGPRSERGYGITAALTTSLPGVDRVTSERLIHAAQEVCPYPYPTRGNVDVGLTLA